MKNKNIFKITLIVAFVLCITGLFALTGCSESSSVTDVYVKTADSPRLTYVQGQELELGNSLLTAVVDGEEIKVKIDSSDVKIAGYDRDKLGEQTITLTYGELSTTITVNVIPRVTAEGYETKYFVGDEFNKEKGKLKIATDKAEYFTVTMKDEKVSLVSFDSTASGDVTATVRYADGNVSYDCGFSVTVYDPAEIKFNAPQKKVDYLSHETAGLAIDDGYFTVKSSDGKLEKIVPLTNKMVSGFNLSAATMANREEALVQEITVEYLGKKFTYNVNIIYSGVSVVNYYAANDLANIDWSKAMTDELVEAARDAITEYYELSDTDKELVSAEVKNKVAAAGAVAVSGLFYKEMAKYNQTFTMDSSLNLYMPCTSYEQTVIDIAKLKDNDEKINVYAKLLRKIEAEFADVVIKAGTDGDPDVTVAAQIYVYGEEQYNNMLEVIEHLVSVNSQLVKVPKNWTKDTLGQYSTEILAAAMQIYNATYFENGNLGYYSNILSKWREKNDTFDMLYTFFLYVYDTDNNPEDNSEGISFMANYMWGQMPMPGRLNDWYTLFYNGIEYQKALYKNENNKALLADVSNFMYIYFMALEISEEIKASANQFWLDIYNAYNIDYMNEMYLYAYSLGYLYHSKGMADSEAYVKLWKEYYDVIKIYKSGNLSATDNKVAICEMFEAFEALSPTELYGFLNSLHYMYNNLTISGQKVYIPVLTYSDTSVYSIFMLVLRNCYLTYMTDAAQTLVPGMLSAMENFALVGYKASALDDFKAAMATLTDTFGRLDKADQDSFKEYFGTSYDKYVAIYNAVLDAESLTLTSNDEALFNAYKTAADRYYSIYNLMVQLSKEGKLTTAHYAVLYAALADCTAAYEKILSDGSDAADVALYTENYELLGGEYTVAQTHYSIVNIAYSLMTTSKNRLNLTVDGKVHYVTVWDLYHTYGLGKILGKMSTAFYYYVDSENVTLTKDYVLSIMQTMRGMTKLEMLSFIQVGGDGVYYAVLNAYLEDTLTNEAAKTLAEKLINAEASYILYGLLSGESAETSKEAFITAMAEVVAGYEGLAAQDKEILNDMYNYYLEIYEDFLAEAEE